MSSNDLSLNSFWSTLIFQKNPEWICYSKPQSIRHRKLRQMITALFHLHAVIIVSSREAFVLLTCCAEYVSSLWGLGRYTHWSLLKVQVVLQIRYPTTILCSVISNKSEGRISTAAEDWHLSVSGTKIITSRSKSCFLEGSTSECYCYSNSKNE
jgi:hypothetical protein